MSRVPLFLGARSLLGRERGVNEVGGSRCCQGFGNWSCTSPFRSVRWNFPDTRARSSGREGLLINPSPGSDCVPTNIPDCSTGTPGVELACWSAFCFLYFMRQFWETMCFLSSEWSLFWCVQETAEELISFSWWLGQGESHLPLPQRAYQEFVRLLVLSAWNKRAHLGVVLFFLVPEWQVLRLKPCPSPCVECL